MWTILKAIFNALKAGEELKNSALWKDKQKTASAIVVVLGALAVILPHVGVHITISQDDIIAIGGGIAAFLSIINGIITVATTKKISIKGVPKSIETTPDKVLTKEDDGSTMQNRVVVEEVELPKPPPKRIIKEDIGLGVGD